MLGEPDVLGVIDRHVDDRRPIDLEALVNREEAPDPQSPFRPRTDPLRVATTRARDRGTDLGTTRSGDATGVMDDDRWPAGGDSEPEAVAATTSTRLAVRRRSLPFLRGARPTPD